MKRRITTLVLLFLTLAVETAVALQNGDFSNGLTSWSSVVIAPGRFPGFPKFLTPLIAQCLPSQTGNPFFALDVPGDAEGFLEQQITVPPAATLRLRSWGSNEPITVTVSLVPTGQAEVVLERYMPPLVENFPNCTTNVPIVKSYDLSAFAGQTVALRLRATSPGFNGAFANFDDIMLIGSPPATGLALWLKADAGVVTDNTGGVSLWADQSGAGHDATQASPTLRPLLVTNVLNGLPTLRFNGSSHWLGITGQVLTSQQFTVLTVVNDTSAVVNPGFREIFSNWSPTNQTTSVFLGTLTNGTQTRARFTDDIGGATDPIMPQGGVGPVVNPLTHFVLTGISTAEAAFVYHNATQIARRPTLNPRDLTTAYNIATQGTTFEFWQGDIVEVLVYDRTLGGSELEQAGAYLQGKYALVSPIPSAGDVDGNQVIEERDANLSLQRLVGLDPTDTVNFLAAGDLDADGVLTNRDAIIMAGVSAERIAPPLDRQRLTVAANGNSALIVQGGLMAAPVGSTVNVRNVTAGTTASAVVQTDGTFSVTISADSGAVTILILDVDGSPAKITLVFSPA